MTDLEVWKDVPGYEGKYMVSNLGRILSRKWTEKQWNHPLGRILNQRTDKFGYKYVLFSVRQKKKRMSVHRAVALAFIPNPDNLSQVNHKDETRDNNYVENLEWCTALYNNRYGHRREKTSENSRGEKNGRAKLTEKQVLEIRSSYIPRDKNFCKRKLAKKYGVSYETITRIVCGTLWTYLLKEGTT